MYVFGAIQFNADQYARSLMNKYIMLSLISTCKSSNTRIPLDSIINNCTDENNIAHVWQDHYNSFVSSAKGNSSKQLTHDKLGTIPSEFKSNCFTISDLNSVLKANEGYSSWC